MTPVSRSILLALLLVVVILGAGCGSEPVETAPVVPAPPQSAALDWVERSPPTGPALVFRVFRFAVTEAGWEADVEVENATDVTWELGADTVGVEQSFGIMLFATGGLDELERRNRDADLPGLRPARSFEPRLAARLRPGERWRGVVSAPGSIAAGRYVRVVFGPLVAVGDPPEGMPARFIWITDHAYRLRGVSGGAEQ
jgi:hypothetical protein